MRRTHNTVADTKTSDCLELTRRLYRGVTDIAKRLDEQKSRALLIADVVTPSGEVLRAKLRDYCEKLIFKDPIGHARKTEELLWRRGFYDIVSAAKKLRKGNTWSEAEKALLSAHLAVGVGFYYHLILKLHSECGLDLFGTIDFAYPRIESDPSGRGSKASHSKLRTEEARQCATRLVHRSLICLGDLARYRLDLDPNWDPAIATRYYKIAVAIDPNVGMPHNQLGTLAGNRNYGLDATYHYMRCILCPETFEGTEGNLQRTMATHSFIGKEKCLAHRCVARLLSLLQLWDDDTANSDYVNQESQELINDIENCLNAERPKPDNSARVIDEDSVEVYLQNCRNEQSPNLTDDMIFKIIALCFMSISRARSKDSGAIQGIIAFMLAVLSLLLRYTIARVQESVIDVALSARGQLEGLDLRFAEGNANKSELENEKTPYVDRNDNEKFKVEDAANGAKKQRDKSKDMLTKLRRPRKRGNSTDSDASDAEASIAGSSSDEFNSDISETEEDAFSEEVVLSDEARSEELNEENEETRALRTANSPNVIAIHEPEGCAKLDEKDSLANSDSVATVTTHIDSGSACDESSDSANAIVYVAQLKKESLDPRDVLDLLTAEGTLASIKICYDWLRDNPDIVKTCARNTRTLLRRAVVLLNLINIDVGALLKACESSEDSALLADAEKLERSVEVVPLPEDIDLRGLKVFEATHAALDWQILRRARMSKREETLLRTLKLIKFGHCLCFVEDSGVRYDENRRLFVITDVKTSAPPKGDGDRNNREAELEHPRGKLMRHMGKLWLKAEVRALESRLRSRLMSPYLVPDHEALAKYMPTLKRLVYAKKFIVVIPSVVVSALDEVKRTSGRAREATRWLEAQLRRGSRFLRAQRPHERLALPLIKGPRPKDKEAWLYFQIIECCHHLTQQTKVGLTNDAEIPVVTLLTGCSAEEQKAISFSPVGLAKSAGVNLEHIESFHTKWKASSKSHG